MFLDKNTLSAGILLVGLYIMVAQPVATSVATVGISILLYAVTRSESIILAFMVASLFVRNLNGLFSLKREPVGVEAFQARDAPNVHARLESVAQKAPKLETITGVLESPDILDNAPLQAMDSLAREGVPGASIPAASKGRGLIHPPAEGFIPAPNGSIETNPMENPYLQNGADDEAVNTSLFDRGTNILNEPVINGAEMERM